MYVACKEYTIEDDSAFVFVVVQLVKTNRFMSFPLSWDVAVVAFVVTILPADEVFTIIVYKTGVYSLWNTNLQRTDI